MHQWKTKIEEKENNTWIFKRVQERLEEIEKNLNEQEKKLLTSYALAVENKLDYIYHNLNIKILNFGIKIGMELEKSFHEYDE